MFDQNILAVQVIHTEIQSSSYANQPVGNGKQILKEHLGDPAIQLQTSLFTNETRKMFLLRQNGASIRNGS